MPSINEKYLKLVMNGAEFWGDIETDVPYTTDELIRGNLCLGVCNGEGIEGVRKLLKGKEVGDV